MTLTILYDHIISRMCLIDNIMLVSDCNNVEIRTMNTASDSMFRLASWPISCLR